MNREPKLVDLGLPSGNLWMTHNLGAASETDSGNYYQFGSLKGYSGDEAKKYSTWDTSPFNNGKNEFDDEYFKANRHRWIYKNGILKPEFDIVTQIYGKDYKIPTKEDFRELLDNITSEFIKDYKNSDKVGRLFTSKINGKTLFFPFSGYTWLGGFRRVDLGCYLWSDWLDPSLPNYAYNLICNSDYAVLGSGAQFYGFALRGIKVKGN